MKADTMGHHRHDQLPEVWARPVPDTGRSLFSDPLDDVLADLRVTRNDARRWYQAGWLSFSIDETGELDLGQQVEIGFIRSLASSGLGDTVLERLLRDLRRPLAYPSNRMAYSFEHGWVVPAEKDPYEVVEENVLDWLEELAGSGETEKLRFLVAKIAEHLDAAVCDDDNQPG